MNLRYLSGPLVLASLMAPVSAWSQTDEVAALRDEIHALQQQLQALEERVVRAQSASAGAQTPVVLETTVPPVLPDSVVHLAGYGALSFEETDGGEDGFGNLLFAPIFHYQYKDRLLFEGELEIDISEQGGTDVALEYLTMDLLLNDNAALVAGKFLSPIGQFRQNLHPSWINKLPSAPIGFGHDQAAPIADVGVQLRGGFGLGSGTANYALFASNGPQLEVETEEEEPHDKSEIFEVHGLETEGFVSNPDGRYIFGGRIGFVPTPGMEVGFSLASGDIGLFAEDGIIDDEPLRSYDVVGMDVYYAIRGLELRGEYVEQEIDSDASSVVPDTLQWSAWYAQASYRAGASKWEPVVRYASFDALEAHDSREQVAIGLNYLFANNIITKVSYEFNDADEDDVEVGDRLMVQLAYGF